MKTTKSIIGRCLLVGVIYTLGSVVVGSLLAMLLPPVSIPPPNMPVWLATTFISGFLVGATLGPIAARIHTTRWRTIFTWTCILFLNLVSVVIEGAFFAPGLLPPVMLPRVLVQMLLVSMATAIAVNWLFPVWANNVRHKRRSHRPLSSWVLRFVGSAASYLAFYYLFGAINYQLVTGPYYKASGNFAVPEPSTVIIAESIRAVLIILSILPLVTALYVVRKRLVLICGFTLFVIGGVVPLLMQAGAMPLPLLLASGVEIFFQNFLTGAVAALLLGRFREVPVRKPRYFVVE